MFIIQGRRQRRGWGVSNHRTFHKPGGQPPGIFRCFLFHQMFMFDKIKKTTGNLYYRIFIFEYLYYSNILVIFDKTKKKQQREVPGGRPPFLKSAAVGHTRTPPCMINIRVCR